MLLGLGVSINLGGVVARMDEVFDGTTVIPPALEVHGQLRGDEWRLVAVMPQQLFARLAVEQHAALADQLAIEKIIVERVGKAIPRRQGAI